MIGSRLVQGWGLSKVGSGSKGVVAQLSIIRGREALGDSHNGNEVGGYFRKHLKFLVAYAGHHSYAFLYLNGDG
jgi:hypothetical protein